MKFYTVRLTNYNDLCTLRYVSKHDSTLEHGIWESTLSQARFWDTASQAKAYRTRLLKQTKPIVVLDATVRVPKYNSDKIEVVTFELMEISE